jgi:hypothetical protein
VNISWLTPIDERVNKYAKKNPAGKVKNFYFIGEEGRRVEDVTIAVDMDDEYGLVPIQSFFCFGQSKIERLLSSFSYASYSYMTVYYVVSARTRGRVVTKL